MIRKIILTIGAIVSCCHLYAQQFVIKGKVVDAQTREVVEYATAALLRADSSLVVGAHTDAQGIFQLKTATAGSYLLKLSFIGFDPQFKQVKVDGRQPVYDVGEWALTHNEQVLGTATVMATAAKVTQVEDTTMFNASAYRVPEGSTLEALVKQLPGVEIEDDGTITWNGKQVKEFLVNGKDFFKGQIDIALQNLPSDWISQIKAYDKQSDYAEQTGIDDGEEHPVLDIVTKRELNQTFIANSDLAYGTEERYFGKIFLSRFTDHSRVSAYGSANNVSDKSFGGKRKRNNGGLMARKNAGMDFYWNNGKGKREEGRLELGGNVNYNHTNVDLTSNTETEEYLATGGTSSYRSSWTKNDGSSTNISSNFRLEWNPDTMTIIQFRPTFSHSEGDNWGNSRTVSFNDDPFSIEGMVSPLDSMWNDPIPDDLLGMAVNRNLRRSQGNRKANNVSGSLNVVRRLNTRGRNLSFFASGGYNHNDNENFSQSTIDYFNGHKDKYVNQYSHMPSHSWNYKVQAGYVEPLSKHWFLEGRYAFSSRYSDSDRSRYNLDRIDSLYGNWYNPVLSPELGILPPEDILSDVRDTVNSQYATYRYYDHVANLNVRYNSRDIRFTAGVNFNPERTEMSYVRPGQGLDTVITRKVFKVTPQLNLRYRFDQRNSIEARYRGYSSQPTMVDLLAVVDNSHPLNVSMGNPGLEPSWTNAFDMGYRGYKTERQQGMAFGFNFTQIRNSVSRLSVYDERTGIRYRRPQNIDGNWHMRTNYMFNTGLGKAKNLTFTTNTNFMFNHAVGYVSSFNSGTGDVVLPPMMPQYDYYDDIFENADVQKNITKTMSIREKVNLAYRNDWLEVATFGGLNYAHTRSDKHQRSDRDTWNYSYGLNANLNFDFGLSFSSDVRMNSRRGYPNAQMNTDELLWNAQVAYSFLKRKAATISLQCYDILQEQSNLSHSISATQRSDSWNNEIHSYYMLHFIYKFRYIGGSGRKSALHKHRNKHKHHSESILDDETVLPQEDTSY